MGKKNTYLFSNQSWRPTFFGCTGSLRTTRSNLHKTYTLDKHLRCITDFYPLCVDYVTSGESPEPPTVGPGGPEGQTAVLVAATWRKFRTRSGRDENARWYFTLYTESPSSRLRGKSFRRYCACVFELLESLQRCRRVPSIVSETLNSKRIRQTSLPSQLNRQSMLFCGLS